MSDENKTLRPDLQETAEAPVTPTPEETPAAEAPTAEAPATEAPAAEAPAESESAAKKKPGRRGKKQKSEDEMTEEEKKEAEKKKRNKPKNTKESAKRLLKYIGEHKVRLVIVALLVISSTAVSALSALLIRPIYATVQSVARAFRRLSARVRVPAFVYAHHAQRVG